MQCRKCRFSPWVGKVPWRKKCQPTPVFLPGKSHGQRTGWLYSPWGRRSIKHDLVNDLPPYVMKGFLIQNKNQSKARSPRGRTISHQIMISCSNPNLQIYHRSENDNATFPISASIPSPLFW